jgi:uncharacterized protein
MREVNKGGVLIDTCTQCRGVWLDRGELEKLIGLVDRDDPGHPISHDRDRDQDRDRHRDDTRDRGPRPFDDDDDDDRRFGRDRPAPSRMSRLFDFFD